MEADLSLGEVQRNVSRHEVEMKEIRAQIISLARDSVTVVQFSDALSSLRREWATDREQAEKLAKERHERMMERFDKLEENTGERLKGLETREQARPMNAWTRFAIVSASILGLLSLIATIVIAVVH